MPADKADATKKKSAGGKPINTHEHRKSLEKNTPRKDPASEQGAGGCSSRKQASSKAAGNNSKPTSASGASGLVTSEPESKENLPVGSEGEETETDVEQEQGSEKGRCRWKQDKGSGEDRGDGDGGSDRGDDDCISGGSSGSGSFKSGSIKSGKRSKKRRSADSEINSSSVAGKQQKKKKKKKSSRHCGGDSDRGGGRRDVDPAEARTEVQITNAGCSSNNSGDSSAAREQSHTYTTSLTKREAEDDVGGRVGAGIGESSGTCAWGNVESRAAKRKKSKKSRRKQQQQGSTNDFGSDNVGAANSGLSGDEIAEDTYTLGSPNAERQYKSSPDAIVPPAFDPDLRATVVAESGGGVGNEDEDIDDAGPGWVSPTCHSGAASPMSNDAKQQQQSPLLSPPQQLPPAHHKQHHHQPKRLTISEEEETTEEEDMEPVRTAGERRGRAAPYNESTAAAAAASSSDGNAAGGGGGGGGGTANVVPVLPAQSSASTADPNTLAAAHVLVSGLGV